MMNDEPPSNRVVEGSLSYAFGNTPQTRKLNTVTANVKLVKTPE